MHTYLHSEFRIIIDLLHRAIYVHILACCNNDHTKIACESRPGKERILCPVSNDAVSHSSTQCVYGRQSLHSPLRLLADTRLLLRSMVVHVCGSTGSDGTATAEDSLAGDWTKDLIYGERVIRALSPQRIFG